MSRKGITPVIAVVLLLLITVGAVASAWGLYQQVISDQSQLDQLNQKQIADNTEIKANSVYKSDDGYVNVSLRNTGGEPVNLTDDVKLLVSPSGTSEYLSENLLGQKLSYFDSFDSSNCFGGSGKVLTTEGDRKELECNTTIKFPDAGQTFDFRISYRNVESAYWDFECSPSSGNSIRCG